MKPSLIFLTIFILQISISKTSPYPKNTNTQFIKTSCNSTNYPKLCYHSLSIYANTIKTSPQLLANTALNVTLKATSSTSRLVKKISRRHDLSHRMSAAVADCVEVVGDSVFELQRSIGEISQDIKDPNFYQVMEDVQTWVSAALTDDDTCMDGFGGEKAMKNGKVKSLIRRHILKISHLTSNALALVNVYASSHEF
ncbi:Plant invertase/pectin methylesterase inhibitor superfamily protein [Euphorbia peplus]|nr:Plant invertase/pectin methylesterase inhibitor superfamily protein [Euphorbia peplus]